MGKFCRNFTFTFLIFSSLLNSANSYAFDFNDMVDISAAFLTNLMVHESGHAVIATQLGAEKVEMKFFGTKKNNLFLGYTEVVNINEKSILPMQLGGEIAVNMGFEYSLSDYRKRPTTYNKALMVFSSTDFLIYSIYSLYISSGSDISDPLVIKKETGFNNSTIIGVALIQTVANAYRVTSNSDDIIPVLDYDKNTIKFSLVFPI